MTVSQDFPYLSAEFLSHLNFLPKNQKFNGDSFQVLEKKEHSSICTEAIGLSAPDFPAPNRGYVGGEVAGGTLHFGEPGETDCFLIRGPAGSGKTAYLGRFVSALQKWRGEFPLCILRGAGVSRIEDLWQQIQLSREGAAWDGVLADLQEGGLTGEAVAEAILQLSRECGGLLVVVDGVSAMQKQDDDGDCPSFVDPEIDAFFAHLGAELSAKLCLVLTSRRQVPSLPKVKEIKVPALSFSEQCTVLRQFTPLETYDDNALKPLIDRLDGQIVSLLMVGALSLESGFQGGEGPEALLPGAALNSLEALFSSVHATLTEADQTLLSLAANLPQGATWEALLTLKASSGSGARLVERSLLVPMLGAENIWCVAPWARPLILSMAPGNEALAHETVGRFYLGRFDITPDPKWDFLAVKHLSAAGILGDAFVAARRLLLLYRAAGRHQEALSLLALLPEGKGQNRNTLGLIAVFRCQISRLSGKPRPGGVEELRQAVAKVPGGERSFALDELGQYLLAYQKYEEAVATMQQSVVIEQADKGENHPDVVASLRALARAQEANNDLDGARKTLEQIVAGGGPTQQGIVASQRAAALHELARMLTLQGDQSAAASHLKESIALRKKFPVEGFQSDITRSLQELAGVDMALGKQTDALNKMAEVVKFEEEFAEGEATESVAAAHGELARFARMVGKNDRAMEALGRQIEVLETLFGVAALQLVGPLQTRGELKAETGNMAGTAGDLQRSVTILKRMGGDPSLLAQTLTQVAGVVQALGDPPACIAYLEEALSLKRSLHTDENHPEILTILTLIGGASKAAGDVNRAVSVFRHLIEAQAKWHGTRAHLDVAVAETNLAQIFLEIGAKAEADPLIEHAYGVFLAEAGPTHPVTVQLAKLVPGSEEGLLTRNPTAPFVKRTFLYLDGFKVDALRLGRLAWRLMLRAQAGPFLPMLLTADLECLTPGTLADNPSQVPAPTKAPEHVKMMWSGIVMELAQAHASFRYDFSQLLNHLQKDKDGNILCAGPLAPKEGEEAEAGDCQALIDEGRAIIVGAERGSIAGDFKRDLPILAVACAFALREDPGTAGVDMASRLIIGAPEHRAALISSWEPFLSEKHREALGLSPSIIVGA